MFSCFWKLGFIKGLEVFGFLPLINSFWLLSVFLVYLLWLHWPQWNNKSRHVIFLNGINCFLHDFSLCCFIMDQELWSYLCELELSSANRKPSCQVRNKEQEQRTDRELDSEFKEPHTWINLIIQKSAGVCGISWKLMRYLDDNSRK